MNASRAVSIVLALAAVGMLATGTLGFTSVSAERAVSVNVVDNEDAYVGVAACAPTNANGTGEAKVYVSVMNRHSTEVTVEEIATRGGSTGDLPSSKTSIATGEWETYRLYVNTSAVTVDVTGGGFDATITANVDASHRKNCNYGQGAL